MKTSRPARFWPAATMPNSAACLMALVVSAPALARPMILAFDACACSRNEEKVLGREGMAHLAHHLAAVLHDDRLGVALERVTEGIVGRQEEPAVAARLHDGLAGPVGQCPGVVGPMDRVGRAVLAGDVGRGAAGDQQDLVLLLRDLVDGQHHGRSRHVDDHVDLVDVEPLARHVGADIRLVLVIGRHDLDLVVALIGLAEILDGLACRPDRALAGQVGIGAGPVVQHPDLDDAVAILGLRRRCAQPERHNRRRAPKSIPH